MTSTPRHRERNIIPTQNKDLEIVFCNGSPTTHRDVPTSWSFDVCDDYVVDNYYRRINAGEIINHPCTYTKETLSHSGEGKIIYGVSACSIRSTYTGPLTARYRELGSAYAPPMIPCEVVDDEARAKLVAIANIDSTPYAFGEDVLELRETLRFLKNPVGSLLDLSRSFRRAYLKKSAGLTDLNDLLKAHSSVYLSYRFALGPLIRSSIDALDAYQSIPPTPSKRYSARGTFDNESTVSQDDVVGYSNHLFDLKRTKRLEGKASILYEMNNPIYDWKYRLGFRLKDLPTTVWQVVPFSFMIDRLLDISSFSKGVINLADPRVTILAGSYRYKLTDAQTWQMSGRNDSNTSFISGDISTSTYFTYDRQVWSPSIKDTIPKLTPKYVIDDATKVADLVSLAISNFNPF